MERLLPIAVVAVVLLAGCSGSPAGDATEASPEPPVPTTAGPTETPRATPAPTPVPDNPWGKEPIVVAVRYDNASLGDHTALVADAIRYWETEGAPYADWAPAFELAPDATDPDIVVAFTARISRCELDHPGRVAGCASVLNASAHPASPEVVEVVPQRTRYYTRETIKHEFGHILGLRHGEEPVDVMDREFVPFSRYRAADYRVYVGYPADYVGESRSRENIRRALEYYDGGAEGWLPANVSFSFTDEPSAADITVVVTTRSPARSTADFRARTVTLNGLLFDRHGWHVGYWIGFFFGAEEAADLPPAFDEPETDDRVDWWG